MCAAAGGSGPFGGPWQGGAGDGVGGRAPAKVGEDRRPAREASCFGELGQEARAGLRHGPGRIVAQEAGAQLAERACDGTGLVGERAERGDRAVEDRRQRGDARKVACLDLLAVFVANQLQREGDPVPVGGRRVDSGRDVLQPSKSKDVVPNRSARATAARRQVEPTPASLTTRGALRHWPAPWRRS